MNGSIPRVASRRVFDWLRIFPVLVLLCCVSGCATYVLKVAYEPAGDLLTPVGSDTTPVTLFLPPVEDQRSRGMRDLNVCFGGSAYTFKTDRPPTDIVREALAAELSSLGVRVSSNAVDAQASFKGTLRRFERCADEESFTVEIQAELQAQEGSRLLWGGTLQSQVTKTTGGSLSTTYTADLSAGLSQALSAAVCPATGAEFQLCSSGGEFARPLTHATVGGSATSASPHLLTDDGTARRGKQGEELRHMKRSYPTACLVRIVRMRCDELTPNRHLQTV